MALIRAIIHQKKIILLDEPTSSLDTETKKIFIDLIQTIKDKTIVVVTHDKTIYDLFDDIIELK
jgi:ABC-type lipoprotein export system ATPase subunit